MIEPQPHVIGIFLLALCVMIVTYFAGGRLRVAGSVLFLSFSTILYGQLVLGLVAPSLTVLTAACDMVTLACIGWGSYEIQTAHGLACGRFGDVREPYVPCCLPHCRNWRRRNSGLFSCHKHSYGSCVFGLALHVRRSVGGQSWRRFWHS
jgi:hypothetical protein